MRSLLARHSEERQAPGRWLTAGSGRLEGRICEVSVERASGAAGAVPRGPFRMKRFQFRLNAARKPDPDGPPWVTLGVAFFPHTDDSFARLGQP